MVGKVNLSLSEEQFVPRRRVLQIMGAAIATALLSNIAPVHANEALEDQFFQISKKTTGHANLDPIIARRLLSALRTVFPSYDEKISQLAKHITDDDTPEDILTKANTCGQSDTVHNLIAAWYIGTATRHMNAPVIAYYNALMYQPTRDALPVPTYCFAEPGWWAQDPPPLGISVQSPKNISPPAPPPVAVETKPPPTTSLKPHLPTSHGRH
ncbi:sugar dehydrogenase complex small subunit [Neokomagataea anthophila]|uniref:Sorbitol dehydrogenase n=1 Tax=Neokomagataea anthophila TaxID=2826925 RepID=A0ABS5E794_9PROT|nr:sugar dehydrogenase complex small subunit [Neokomagataea anthophila]MBR0559773.1 hypothetical protein [Neokomagataea anthophila]